MRQVAQGCKETLALPLLGVPVGVKDNLCTKGVPTTAASRILEGYLPSYDAAVVSKLKEAGAIVVSGQSRQIEVKKVEGFLLWCRGDVKFACLFGTETSENSLRDYHLGSCCHAEMKF